MKYKNEIIVIIGKVKMDDVGIGLVMKVMKGILRDIVN